MKRMLAVLGLALAAGCTTVPSAEGFVTKNPEGLSCFEGLPDCTAIQKEGQVEKYRCICPGGETPMRGGIVVSQLYTNGGAEQLYRSDAVTASYGRADATSSFGSTLPDHCMEATAEVANKELKSKCLEGENVICFPDVPPDQKTTCCCGPPAKESGTR